MAYLGIGYNGPDQGFLREFVENHRDWLSGDRKPRFYGDGFLVLYDSNTAREFAHKCRMTKPSAVVVYPMGRPVGE